MTEITLKSLISAFLFGQVLVASLKESEFPLVSFRAEVHRYLEKEPKDPFSLIKDELEAGNSSYDHEEPLGYLECTPWKTSDKQILSAVGLLHDQLAT